MPRSTKEYHGIIIHWCVTVLHGLPEGFIL